MTGVLRRWAAPAVVTAVAVVAAAAVVTSRRPAADAASPAAAPAATATITRQTLQEVRTASGKLAYGAELAVEARLTGTVTWLPAPGATIARGAPLYKVDDKPVVLLSGALPSYRDLTPGAAAIAATATTPATAATPGTEGADVRQFEENLRALGYTGFPVDDTYTDATARAVRRWQKKLGLPQTGIVELGRVHYAAGAVRIAEQKTAVGRAVGGPVLTCTGTVRAVTASLKVHEQRLAAAGTKVTVALATGKELPGSVISARPAPAEGEQSEPALEVQIAIADPGPTDDTVVKVRFLVGERKDVLAVPVAALLALAGGGYGVEVVEKGRTRIVAVTTGLFADGKVEIGGTGLEAGMAVGTAE